MWGQMNCVYHSDETYGPTYDSEGNICPSLTWDDKLALIIGLGLCGLILLATAGLWYTRLLVKRSKLDDSDNDGHRPLMRTMATPLPLPPTTPAQPTPTPDILTTTRRPSDDPSQFHFPILSADGELLPPPRRSSVVTPRPLPVTPEPTTPTRWTGQLAGLGLGVGVGQVYHPVQEGNNYDQSYDQSYDQNYDQSYDQSYDRYDAEYDRERSATPTAIGSYAAQNAGLFGPSSDGHRSASPFSKYSQSLHSEV